MRRELVLILREILWRLERGSKWYRDGGGCLRGLVFLIVFPIVPSALGWDGLARYNILHCGRFKFVVKVLRRRRWDGEWSAYSLFFLSVFLYLGFLNYV